MKTDISAAILAGGSGKRLGGVTKSAIPINGTTILSRMLPVIREIFREIILVTNFPENTYRDSDITIIPDLITGKGPLGGIHAALKKTSAGAVFVFAGDMPFLDKALIKAQIICFKDYATDILVPRTGEMIEPLHAIYSKKLAGSLEKYLESVKDHAVRDFLRMENAKYFDINDPERLKKAFMNINSPEDIVIAEKILQKDKT